MSAAAIAVGRPGIERQAFTIKEVAAMTGFCERKIGYLISGGQLKSVRIGRSRRIRREDLDEFLGREQK